MILLLVGGAACGGASGGDTAASDLTTFCEELQAGAQRLDANVARAGDDAGEQVELIVRNVGEFTRLVHSLDDVAPSEIRADMHTARQAWDEQAEIVAEGVRDPIAGIAHAFATGILGNGAVVAVDQYANENCGRTLFGSLQETADVTTTTAQRPDPTTATTRAPGPAILPADAVAVACDYPTVRVLRARPPAAEDLEEVYTFDAVASAAELGIEVPLGAIGGCSTRAQFSEDFSKFVYSGYASGGGSHSLYADLATGDVTDLTAPRQGTGFSADVLDEPTPWFAPAPDRATFENRIVIGDIVVDPDNPATSSPWDRDIEDILGVSGIDEDPAHSRTVASPDGRFIAWEGSSVVNLATGSSIEIPYECGSAGRLLGWRDAATLVLFEESQIHLVNVDAAGVPTGCTNALPSHDREIVHARLRLDAQAAIVTVAGAEAEEIYLVSLDHQTEPTLTNAAPIDPALRIYHPRAG